MSLSGTNDIIGGESGVKLMNINRNISNRWASSTTSLPVDGNEHAEVYGRVCETQKFGSSPCCYLVFFVYPFCSFKGISPSQYLIHNTNEFFQPCREES